MRALHSSVMVMLTVARCLGAPQGPCFAFLLHGDVSVRCEGMTTQVTHRGNIDRFAVSYEGSVLGFVTSCIKKRTATESDALYTTTLIDLRSGKHTEVVGQNSLVSTCGGIFWAYDAKREHSGTRDLITGEEITPPYRWFRCSSDRKVVVGTVGNSGDNLYIGTSPEKKVAPAERPYFYTFDVSPDGSKIAYTSHSRVLCVFSSGLPQCADENSIAAFADGLSVNDRGEVLVATDTPQECFYKSPSNFSTTPAAGASRDACLGIGYWKPSVETPSGSIRPRPGYCGTGETRQSPQLEAGDGQKLATNGPLPLVIGKRRWRAGRRGGHATPHRVLHSNLRLPYRNR
jgi:hypothetical protein